MRPGGVWLALAVLLCLPVKSFAARPYSIEDLMRHESIGRVMTDPAGRWLAFEKRDGLLSTARPDRIALSHVLRARPYLVDLHGEEAPRALLPDTAGPGTILLGFSPRGTQLALARLEGERYRLGIAETRSGSMNWLPYVPAYDGVHDMLAWLSDDEILFIAETHGRVPWRLAMDTAPDRVRARWDATAAGRLAVTAIGSGRYLQVPKRAARRLLLLDLRTGKIRIVAQGHFSQLILAPGRQSIALVELAHPLQPSAPSAVGEDDGFFMRTLHLVDLASGESWTPCPACMLRGEPRWDDNGRRIAFFGEEAAGLTAIVADMTSRSHQRVDDSTGRKTPSACVLPVPAGARLALAPDRQDHWHAPIRCRAAPDERIPAWTPLGWQSVSGSLKLDMGGSEDVQWSDPLHGPVASIEAMQLTGSRTAALLRLQLASGETHLLLSDGRSTRRLMVLNRHMRGIAPAIMRRLDHPSSQGETVNSWLVLPPGKDNAVGLPLVVIPYPGQMFGKMPPADQRLSGERPFANAQLLAAQGFAVLLPSLPMPSVLPDRGYAFAAAIQPALEAAFANGCCDRDRLALWGHSYGGYAAAMTAAQAGHFRAVVASAGIYDLAGTVGTFSPSARIAPEEGLWIASAYGWAEAGQGRMGSAPWVAPQRYTANSPVYLADRISSPMLLIAADRDFSPLGQAEQLFSALFRQGKDAQLVTYWGEGHVVASPANLRDLYARVVDFLNENLLISPQAD